MDKSTLQECAAKLINGNSAAMEAHHIGHRIINIVETAADLLDDIRLDSGSDTFAAVRRQSDAIKALNTLLGS